MRGINKYLSAIILTATIMSFSGCAKDASPDPAEIEMTRQESISEDAVKVTPVTDIYPVAIHSDLWSAPVPMPGPVNTAGVEDAPVITPDGQTLSSPYVRALMKRLMDKASIEKRMHYHGLRHTCTWELAKEGVPMPIIQNAIGHTSLQTTDRYLRYVAPHDVIDVMKSQ